MKLEVLTRVEDCLWKLIGVARILLLLSTPLRRTKKSPAGSLPIVTRKSPPPIGCTPPLISCVPEDSTNTTSVTSAESLPVTVTTRVALLPGSRLNEDDEKLRESQYQYICIDMNAFAMAHRIFLSHQMLDGCLKLPDLSLGQPPQVQTEN